MRLVWLIIIGISTYITIYTAYNTTSQYTEYDVITVTKNIEEKEVVFPSLTVCAPVLFDYGNVFLGIRHINSCKFNDLRCNHSTDSIEFTRELLSINTNRFSCVRILGFKQNITPPFKTLSSLESNGLLLRLNLNISYFKFYVQDNYINTYRHSIEYTLAPYDTLRVYATKTVDKKLEEPYNNCQKFEDDSYRRENCIEMCVHEQIRNSKNCSVKAGYYIKNKTENLPFCFPNGPSVNDEWELISNASIVLPCQKSCPKNCYSTDWNLIISPDSTSGLTNTTSIRVVLQQMDHLELSQIPKQTFFDFLSSLGGTLGFLGMSFLSFVEVFEFIIEIILTLFC